MNKGVAVGVLAVVALGVGVLAIGLVGAGMFLSARGTGRVEPSEGRHADIVVVDEAHVLFVEGAGIETPQRVRAQRPDGAVLTELWQFSFPPGRAAHPWNWRVDGARIAAETHVVTGDGEASVEVLDAARGHVLTVPAVLPGSWALLPGGDVALRTTTDVVLVHGDGVAWQSPLALGEYLAQLGASAAHVVMWDGAVHVLDRQSGAEQPFAAPGELVGLASQRDEVLLRQGESIAAVSLADGTSRTLDLGRPVVDDTALPCLLGQRDDRWLVLFSTTMTHSFQVDGRSWATPGQAVLAAIDPATGTSAWRTELGEWNLECRRAIVESGLMAADDPLPAITMLRGNRAEESGDLVGHLLAVDVASGVIVWESTYAHDTSANALFQRYGDVTWMTIPETAEPFPILLVRFEGARLSGSVRLDHGTDAWGPALRSDGWVWSGSWQHLGGPSLTVAATGPDATPVADARAVVQARLSLPPAAIDSP